MKKMIFTLLMPAILAIGAFTGIKNNNSLEANALSYETEINVGPGFFYDMDPNAGQFGDANTTFWGEGYAFNSMGTFFRGESAENWTGTLVSRTWTQHTQYVYFTWSAQNNSDQVNIKFVYEGGSILLKNTAFIENMMMLWYAKIPDEDFARFNGENFEMHVELFDDAQSNFGFNNFGYLHVNQSEEQVSDAMRYYLNHLRAPINQWEIDRHKDILNHYYHNDHLRRVFLRTVDNVNEDFEDNTTFVNHWYIDYNYDNNDMTARHVDNVIGSADYRLGTNMPFNKSGDGFFRGWYEASDNTGYTATDGAIYRFVSRPFVLNETGIVSIKMAGRSASLHVIDVETNSDLAWVDVRSYNKEGEEENVALSGMNTVTMVRHIINLEMYVGKTIQLALADVYDSVWASSYFDELITDYSSVPSFKIDVATQALNEQNPTYPYYFDQYIASTHIDNDPQGIKYVLGSEEITKVDVSDAYKAYKKLNEYYSLIRNIDNGFAYDSVEENDLKAFVSGLSGLNENTMNILNNSSDLIYEDVDLEVWYETKPSTESLVGAVINDLIDSFTVYYFVSFDSNGGTGNMESVEVIEGSEYTLPECGFNAPEGQQFASWLVNEESLKAGDIITVIDDVEIKAVWEDIPPIITTYTISFDSNGGEGTMESVIVNEGAEYVLPACTFVAPEGKEFDAWLVNEENKQPGDKVVVSTDLEIKATWKDLPPIVVNTYTVSFDSNGGTGSMNPVTLEEGEEFTLPECEFTAPDGKEFDYWLISEEGANVGDKITINSDLEVKAIWKDIPVVINTYTITFNPNGGTGSMNSITLDEGTEYTLPACGFTAPKDKEFESWSVNDKEMKVGDKIVVNSDMVIKVNWKDVEKPVDPAPTSKGCGGSIAATSLLLSTISLAGVILVLKKRKNEK